MTITQDGAITRNRERLACIECRRRKLKCDRTEPCGSCVRRSKAAQCSYQRFARPQPSVNGDDAPAQRQLQLEGRLDRLEDLVRKVSAQSGPPASQQPKEAVTDQGDVAIRDVSPPDEDSQEDRNVFAGATHWSSIWNDIQGLRDAISDAPEIAATSSQTTESSPASKTSLRGPGPNEGVDILFGGAPPMSLAQVLKAHLPSQTEMDGYVAAYFSNPAIVVRFIHDGQLRDNYREFWDDPLSAPPLFTSILFSICNIASRTLPGGPRDKGGRDFSAAAGHCLVLGQYFRPKPFAVEALLLHVMSQILTSKMVPPSIAPVLGLLAGVSIASGYHRNPDVLGMTPFEAEMRRRTWSMVVQVDMQVAFHLGIPSAMQGSVNLAGPPTNLDCSDFGPETMILPPAQPISKHTDIQYCVVKHGFMDIFGRILSHALHPHLSLASMGDMRALEAELEAIYDALPATLKPTPVAQTVFQPVLLIVSRVCTLLIYYKCLCVLHRPYVLLRQPESIRRCHEASSMLLNVLLDDNYKLPRGSQALSTGWLVSSLVWNDMLLGAVTLCLSSLVATQQNRRQQDVVVVNTRDSLDLLQKVVDVCAAEAAVRGAETGRVRQIVEATMERLQQPDTNSVHAQGDGSVRVADESVPADDWFASGGDWSLPTAMQHNLWDDYLAQYLNLDFDAYEQ